MLCPNRQINGLAGRVFPNSLTSTKKTETRPGKRIRHHDTPACQARDNWAVDTRWERAPP